VQYVNTAKKYCCSSTNNFFVSLLQRKPTDEADSTASPLKKQRQSPRRKAGRVARPLAESRGRPKQKHAGIAGEAGPSTVLLPLVSYPAELGYSEDVHRKAVQQLPKVGNYY